MDRLVIPGLRNPMFGNTGWRGGLKARTFSDMIVRDSTWVIKQAIRRMLPKSKLGKTMLTKFKAYPGADHPHAAQGPTALDLETI